MTRRIWSRIPLLENIDILILFLSFSLALNFNQMEDTESLKDNSQQPNRKKWESPQLESWNTEELLALNPLHFLLNKDQTFGS